MRTMHRTLTYLASFARAHARSLAVTLGAIALALAVGGAHTDASSGGRTVTARGSDQFVPNVKVMATFRFSPGHITIASGENLTFANDTAEPHTLSIVNKSDLPTDTNGVFNCGAPGTVCDEIFSQFSAEPTSSLFLNVTGGPGLDGRLDTIFVLPGDSASAPVSAPSGTTLYFICAIHAWMQGTINVR